VRPTKKILFYYSIFNLGGAERSTNKLVTKLLDKGYSVDILLITKGGNFENEIDNRANIFHLRSGDFGNKYTKSKGLYKAINLLLYCLTLVESIFKSLLFRFKKYNVVIIGLHGLSPKFCLTNIKSEIYIQFLRSDLSKCDNDNKAKNLIKKYVERIDYYVAVSQTAKDAFIDLFPNYEQKVKKIYNIIKPELIIEKSKESLTQSDLNYFNNQDFKILTVCRIQDKSKAIFRMLEVFKKMTLEFSDKITWYIIGDGIDFDKLRHKVKDAKLDHKMILMGNRSNPYPYFNKVNLVAVLSYYEGLCGVVNEAKVLKKPLIATEFSGIHEQIQHRINGVIVSNNFDAIYTELVSIIKDQILLDQISINGMPESINNDNYKIQQLEALFNNINE
jgi:glycosyltransferase involved in cell wall biosynthesis